MWTIWWTSARIPQLLASQANKHFYSQYKTSSSWHLCPIVCSTLQVWVKWITSEVIGRLPINAFNTYLPVFIHLHHTEFIWLMLAKGRTMSSEGAKAAGDQLWAKANPITSNHVKWCVQDDRPQWLCLVLCAPTQLARLWQSDVVVRHNEESPTLKAHVWQRLTARSDRRPNRQLFANTAAQHLWIIKAALRI